MRLGTPALELMSYQNDNTVPLLREQFSILKTTTLSTKDVFESGIEKTLRDRFNVAFEFRITKDQEANAFAEIPPISKNHVLRGLTPAQFGGSYGRLLSNFNDRNLNRTSVNISTMRVDGILSKVPVIVGLTSATVKNTQDLDELIAILLHEVGHVFTTLYYLLHSCMANLITVATAAAAVGASSDKERSMIIKRGYRIMGIDNVGVDEHLSQTKEQIEMTMQTLYVNDTANGLRSETGASIYEVRCAEQLADYFATRFGLGLPLARWISRNEPFVNQQTRARASVLAGLFFFGNLFTSPIKTFNEILTTNLYDENISNYDTPKERIETIRKYIIQDIKEARLSPEVEKNLLAQAQTIKSLLEEVEPYPNTLQWLKGKFNPLAKTVKNTIQFQKDLESLMYNDIYLSAKKFELGVKP